MSHLSLVSKNGASMNETALEQLLAAYPNTLTVADVAAVLRVDQRSVQRWAREGRVASVRVGRGYRFLRSDVLTFLHAARIHASAAAALETVDRQPGGESA
jgi:excisionase family DNA binding protein